jgi:hypothetical protein
MPETRMVSLKGRIHEFGPRLDLPAAADVVYVGRRCTMGGWRLACSPYANKFTAQEYGGALAAVEEYLGFLRKEPGLVRRARMELPGKRLGCFCRETQDPRVCHAALWARIVGADLADLPRLLGLTPGRPTLTRFAPAGGAR